MMVHPTPTSQDNSVKKTQDAFDKWNACQFLTCSVLPVRMACNLRCPFCFSKSSVSSLKRDVVNWDRMDVERYFEFAMERGAKRLVITGGGEPLLQAEAVVSLVRRGKKYFDEIACFTNGSMLTGELAIKMLDAGLSYLCYSRHHYDDDRCSDLMGSGAPKLGEFVACAKGIPIRATCVMTRGWIDSPEEVQKYLRAVGGYGVDQFTFKHTYVAYEGSLFGASSANAWAKEHQVESDPFLGLGEVIATLPWGPQIRRIGNQQICYYFEPTPNWEVEHQLCRSSNLLSDGTVYASLEDQLSQLFRLKI